MYEPYTRQSLPPRYYRELLGSALCVFNSNNAFIIENLLRLDDEESYEWYKLIDLESGKLKPIIRSVITEKSDSKIEDMFCDLVERRNRIIHSFRITNKCGEQSLATKEKQKDGGKQFEITEDYLLSFIALNQELSDRLHDLRGF